MLIREYITRKERTMQYLFYRESEPDLYGEIIPELKSFFNRVQQVRRTLRTGCNSPHLNRIQRERCKNNLFVFERAAREFSSIDNQDDFYLLHRKLQKYLRLGADDLRMVLGRESTKRVTLFVHCG